MKDLRDRLAEENPLFKDPSSSRDGIRLLPHRVWKRIFSPGKIKECNPEKKGWNSCSPIGPSGRRSCPPTPVAREGETIPVFLMHADDAPD